jgi:hypothetical protein
MKKAIIPPSLRAAKRRRNRASLRLAYGKLLPPVIASREAAKQSIRRGAHFPCFYRQTATSPMRPPTSALRCVLPPQSGASPLRPHGILPRVSARHRRAGQRQAAMRLVPQTAAWRQALSKPCSNRASIRCGTLSREMRESPARDAGVSGHPSIEALLIPKLQRAIKSRQ